MVNTYTINDYLQQLTEAGLVKEAVLTEADLAMPIGYLSYDSNDIRENTLFVCKGAHFKAAYLLGALKQGACCYVAEQAYGGAAAPAPHILVTDIREAMVLLGKLFYNDPAKELSLIGITGTKGKSSTAYFIKSILDCHLGRSGKPKSAILSSIENYDGVIFEESHLTTPEAMMLMRHFRNAVNSGISHLTMEVSSQALKYNRVDDVRFEVGIFLNIGEDHISAVEHVDFDDYFEAKLRLFAQCKTACINSGSDHFAEILEAAQASDEIITFGQQESDHVYGYQIRKEGDYTTFMVRTRDFDQQFRLAIPGLFNVDNALAAIACGQRLGIPVADMVDGLAEARVSGRMEVFRNVERDLTVIVDYAHNRMSFESLFRSTLQEYPDCSIYAIFGCPGMKAQRRRQELAEIAGRYAKKVYVTEEDHGEEDLLQVCQEIADNLKDTDSEYAIIPDREEAIRTAIAEAADHTVILLTGKGRETRMKRGTAYIETPSDVDYVEKYLG